jgi:hypothetical protein
MGCKVFRWELNNPLCFQFAANLYNLQSICNLLCCQQLLQILCVEVLLD